MNFGVLQQGGSVGDLVGRSVASAGDVNRDGISDFLIGADGVDSNGNYDAEATNLGTLTAGMGVIFQGEDVSYWAGYALVSAGDVNGDGWLDILRSKTT